MMRIFLIALIASIGYSLSNAAAQQIDLEQLLNDPYQDGYAAWSPDGRFIIYTSVRDGKEHLWKIPAEGGEPVKVTEHRSHQGRFSPEGAYIAFDGEEGTLVQIMSASGGVSIRIVPESIPIKEKNIWKVPLAGGEARQLTFHEYASNADVSPDGAYIVFSSFSLKDRNADLGIMPYAGGEPMQLTFEPSPEFEARWSPDGNKLVFTNTRSGHCVMTLDLKLIAQKLNVLNDTSH